MINIKKLTNQEFLKRLKKNKGNEYEPLDEYKGSKVKIRFRHNTCGRVFYATPDNIYNGGCIECGYEKMKKAQRKTKEDFLREVDDLVGDDYKFIDDYINNTTKIKVLHTVCNHTYEVTPRDFLSGRRCPNCKNKRISKSNTLSHHEFMQNLSKVLESDYEVLSEYKNAKTKIKIRHTSCGLIYDVLPHKILNGGRCPTCSFINMGRNRSKPHHVFVKDVYKVSGGEYEVLGEYYNNSTKILMRHNSCNTEFLITPDSFLRGSGCAKCKESTGEQQVRRILDKHNIRHLSQYKFDDCKYKEMLSFDFAVMDDSGAICLIEYQGIQHYFPVEFFGGQSAFVEQKVKDDIKRNYTKRKNIPLVEIPYHIKNIETYLIDELTKLIPR